MKRRGPDVFLEKADVIRMNQLVRRQVDYDGFRVWFASLQPDEQAALVGELCHCAYQAGVDETVHAEASALSGLSQSDEFITLMKNVKGPGGLNFGGLAKWLRSAEPDTRDKAFRWFVYLFGVAEGRRFRGEDPGRCNHWWHRNLEDPRVVQSIMTDPEYYKTSPRDDEGILGGSK